MLKVIQQFRNFLEAPQIKLDDSAYHTKHY